MVVKGHIVVKGKIDKLIINSPFTEPTEHWEYDRQKQSFDRVAGRRSAGYLIASRDSKSFDDPGIFVPIKLVNQIRERVNAWRVGGYAGVTSTTKRLLEHWTSDDDSSAFQLFFCQLEAIETLIWLTEANENEKVGLNIPNDGGDFLRFCSKMATGSGKTVVMAMTIAWHVLNKVAAPNDKRFSKNILIIAPGLTVRNRLEVLKPDRPDNYYKTFDVVPPGFSDKIHQARILIHNWHKLDWETDAKIATKKGVDKRGAKSDTAYVREVLGELSRFRNLLVINDEAHHAWRVPAESKTRGIKKDEIDQATKWVGGLDRINRTVGILACYDFTATPFAPSGKQSNDEALFSWIVSDFSLNDAIESGLVKTPRVVVRDDKVPDAKTYKSRLYHIYDDDQVKSDINQKAPPESPLPDLVRNAYYLLGLDWEETANRWRNQIGVATPPVMITVVNRTETAARVKHAFDRKQINVEALCDEDRTLHIDSKVLKSAESDRNTGSASAQEKERVLRELVDTVGKVGKSGEQIQNVISVGMLSEGWDAKTVTHIMGLRAFSSQLLCEQVVGRGLRRTSYEINEESGLFDPEYVNIFGVPFTFLPHEETVDTPGGSRSSQATKEIKPVAEKLEYEITWPVVVRLNHRIRAALNLDWSEVKPLKLDASHVIESAELAPSIAGKEDLKNVEELILDWERVSERLQTLVFQTCVEILDQVHDDWQGKGSKIDLLRQLIPIVDRFMRSEKVTVSPVKFNRVEELRRGVITLNRNRIVQHIWEQIRLSNAEIVEPIFDSTRSAISSTGEMIPWYTRKPCAPATKSHINFCVLDSSWESSDAYTLDHHKMVHSWAKNDHLGFEVFYRYKGVARRYLPDFIVKLVTGENLIVETKGIESERDRIKQNYLSDWINAINNDGRFGRWSGVITRTPGELSNFLDQMKSL